MGKNSSEGSNNTWIWIVIAIVVIAVIAIFAIKGCGTKEYSIKFDTDGGNAISSVKVKEDGTITMPSNPTREGYEFAGWYVNDEIFDFNTKVTKDMTLKARWNKIGEEESKITLNSTKLTLDVNETEKLKVTASGSATTDGLVWKSSDEKIVTVDENGNLKALKEGKVTITVTTKDGKYSAECTVTVSKASETVAPEEMTISGTNTVEVGKTITLKISSVKPSNASKSVTWTSSDKNIATVNTSGKVTGKKEGKVTIKATSKVDKSVVAEYTVTVTPKSGTTVKPEDTKVTISGGSTVNVGETLKLTATVTPSGKTVTWTSSDEKTATVDASGNVKGVKAGKVTITATVNGVKATHEVTVVESNYKVRITLNKTAEGMTSYTYKVEVLKDGKAYTAYKGFTIDGKVQYKANSGTLGEAQVKQLSNSSKAVITLNDGTKVNNVSVEIIKN